MGLSFAIKITVIVGFSFAIKITVIVGFTSTKDKMICVNHASQLYLSVMIMQRNTVSYNYRVLSFNYF